MNKTYHGGPAFPTQNAEDYFHGMTLRDYFAAKAMHALRIEEAIYEASSNGESPSSMDEIARDAYAQADAMLKARAQ